MTPKTYGNTTPGKVLAYFRKLHAEAKPDCPEAKLSSAELIAALGIERRLVSDALTALARRGDIVRTGRRNSYRYSLPKEKR